MADRGAGKCQERLPWVGSREHDCEKPDGHLGVHRCGCGEEWRNEADYTPCPSRAVAVLGMVNGPAEVRCGYQADHSGPHRFSMEWTGGEVTEIDARRIGRGGSLVVSSPDVSAEVQPAETVDVGPES